jgi:predicted nucleotidyltransferase component of viral defense system
MKIAAMLARGKGRDYYDVMFLHFAEFIHSL